MTGMVAKKMFTFLLVHLVIVWGFTLAFYIQARTRNPTFCGGYAKSFNVFQLPIKPFSSLLTSPFKV